MDTKESEEQARKREELEAQIREATYSPAWRSKFDERQNREIDFAVFYANQFNHGTDGHNTKIIIARMATLLDALEAETQKQAT